MSPRILRERNFQVFDCLRVLISHVSNKIRFTHSQCVGNGNGRMENYRNDQTRDGRMICSKSITLHPTRRYCKVSKSSACKSAELNRELYTTPLFGEHRRKHCDVELALTDELLYASITLGVNISWLRLWLTQCFLHRIARREHNI